MLPPLKSGPLSLCHFPQLVVYALPAHEQARGLSGLLFSIGRDARAGNLSLRVSSGGGGAQHVCLGHSHSCLIPGLVIPLTTPASPEVFMQLFGGMKKGLHTVTYI